jgi:hypothetical protein
LEVQNQLVASWFFWSELLVALLGPGETMLVLAWMWALNVFEVPPRKMEIDESKRIAGVRLLLWKEHPLGHI